MTELKDIQAVYFLGIGGIGMSAIARYFHETGVRVEGYDKTPSVLTRQLEEEGIRIHYTDDAALVPKDVQLVVYTPAIPKDHAGYQYYLQQGYPVVKRSDVLQLITEPCFNICIAGTHGKTTISTLAGHLLRHSGYGCNAFLGGIPVNYNRNFWMQPSDNEKQVCVVEADEYDRSFHKLSPDIAVITAMDPDHLDIYGTPAAMEEAFVEFTRRIRPGGWLISKYGLKRQEELVADHRITYHLSDNRAAVHTRNLKVKQGGYLFDVVFNTENDFWVLQNVHLTIGGLHNVENTVAAVAVAHILGIEDEKIKEAIAAFKGVKRRFEYVVEPAQGKLVFIDDYAHHPEELKALIQGARSLFEKSKLVLVFQPHLFSRTRDLAAAFASSLGLADEVVLLPIYPARELPVEGVTSYLIAEQIQGVPVHVMEKEELLTWSGSLDVTAQPVVFITAGAGDIDLLLPELKKKLTHA